MELDVSKLPEVVPPDQTQPDMAFLSLFVAFFDLVNSLDLGSYRYLAVLTFQNEESPRSQIPGRCMCRGIWSI